MDFLFENNYAEVLNFLKRRIGYVDLIVEGGNILIETMPPRFDRGNYLVKAFSDNPIIFPLDSCDLFPRYYYEDESLILEVSGFISAKKLKQKDLCFREYKFMDDSYEE